MSTHTMKRTHGAPAPAGRVRAAWAAAHAPVAGVPRRVRNAALAVPLVVLPSGLWRIATEYIPAMESGGDTGDGGLPGWLPGEVYIVLLSVFSELVAFTAVGLIAAWGEVFPRWVPVLRGRGVPPLAAVVPAAIGAVLLTVVWTAAFAADFAGVTLQGDPTPAGYPGEAGGWISAVYYVCYIPLLLWGPLLGLVTAAYWRRRRAGRPEGIAARRRVAAGGTGGRGARLDRSRSDGRTGTAWRQRPKSGGATRLRRRDSVDA
ncbi:hypothetical protein ABZ714_26340 [Streptomyces sp. NPDC006798]|uniref:hypothetical protein n=1 Tax=Streptomyces sp. NPDC006798 TaxID=3155462 RepID=UPI0033DA5DA3